MECMNAQARSAPSSPRLMMNDLDPASPEVPSSRAPQVESALGMSHAPAQTNTEHVALGRSSSPTRQQDPGRPAKVSAVSSLTASLAALAGIRTREEAAEQSRSDSPSSRVRVQAGLRRHSFESSLAARQKHAHSLVPAQHGATGAASGQAGDEPTRDQLDKNEGKSAARGVVSDGVGKHVRGGKGSKPGTAGRPHSRPHSLDDERLRDMQSGQQPPFDVDKLPLHDDPD